MEKIKNKIKNKTFVVLLGVIILSIISVVVMLLIMNQMKEPTIEENMLQASTYLEEEKYEDAIVLYNKVLEKEPDNLSAILGKAEGFFEISGSGNAIDALDSAIVIIKDIYASMEEVPEQTQDIYYLYADIMVAAGNNELAYDTLKQGELYIEDLLEKYTNSNFINPEDTDWTYVNEDGYIEFGLYPQRELMNFELDASIIDAEYSNNTAMVGENKYFRLMSEDGSYRYFLFQPITWRIINQDEQGYLLLSDVILDTVPYNVEYVESSWETSSLRSWLIEDFYKAAFSEKEQQKMLKILVTPSQNPDYGMITGIELEDYVTILSAEEVSDGMNGFEGDKKAELDARVSMVSEYAQATGTGLWTNDAGKWWLRTCGLDTTSAMFVNTNGILACSGYYVFGDNIGVRPTIYISLDAVEVVQ